MAVSPGYVYHIVDRMRDRFHRVEANANALEARILVLETSLRELEIGVGAREDEDRDD